jgi:predicted RNA binding protein YcfA (HicA-like mRNA interferase family)
MTKKSKLVEKFLENPDSIRYSQLVTILEEYGFERIQAKGSHVKFKHPKLSEDLIIPIHNGDCKEHYKQQARKFVEKIK